MVWEKMLFWPKPHLLYKMWWARQVVSEVWLIWYEIYPSSIGIWWPRAVLHQVRFTLCHLVFSYWRGKSYIHCNAGDMSSWKLSNLCKFKFLLLFLMLCLLFQVIFVVLCTQLHIHTTTTTNNNNNNNNNKMT